MRPGAEGGRLARRTSDPSNSWHVLTVRRHGEDFDSLVRYMANFGMHRNQVVHDVATCLPRGLQRPRRSNQALISSSPGKRPSSNQLLQLPRRKRQFSKYGHIVGTNGNTVNGNEYAQNSLTSAIFSALILARECAVISFNLIAGIWYRSRLNVISTAGFSSERRSSGGRQQSE